MELIRKGDTVMCTGDHWMQAGAIGEVDLVRGNGESAHVVWHTWPSGNPFDSPKGLYHSLNALTKNIKSAKLDPNWAFKRRKQLYRP